MPTEGLDRLGPPRPSTGNPYAVQADRRSTIRVLLVDDHRMLRQGLRSIIDDCDSMQVVGEASNGVEAIEAVAISRPDVVVMDINMPKMNGIQATQHIKQMFPETAIIGLSVQTGREIIEKMQAAGISFYLTKESAVETLCAAIEDAVTHKK